MKIINTMSALFMLSVSLGIAQTGNAQTVHMQKANTSFAIDGNNGSVGDREQVYLYNANQNNVNQQWTEHDRGNGYYSYQKVNTSLCLDGGNGGARLQIVKLWQCGDSNENQHWRKVSTGGNSYRLEKRNAPNFSIDGNRGGANLQGIYLWDSNSENVNQQWVLSTIGDPVSNCNQVNSLSELRDYLSSSNQCVQMAPGTYTFDTTNTGPDKLFSDPILLLFSGSNSQFIFDDVKFEYDTNIFRQFGSVEVIQFQVASENNVYQGLTMEDIGNVTPTRTALAISLDGADNLMTDFHVTTRGSYPYGYGDIFGKGSGSVIGHRKHGAVQFRGDRNYLKDSEFYLRSYGHGIFIQGAHDALIEGVVVEGELRTVAEVLAEEGTGSPADDVDFLTVWGFNLKDQRDYHFSLQEDGIRAYSSGLIYGTNESRDTGDITVLDSTVRFMRSGVTIGLGRGSQYVENVTALGTESGFWVGSGGVIVNSRGDTSVGPLYSEDLGRSGVEAELTILPHEVTKIGNTPSFYLGGSDHNFTINDGTSSVISGVALQIGGTRYGHRWLDGSDEPPPITAANDIEIDNQTPYRLSLENNSSNTTGSSCGPITDNGSNNDVRQECN